MSFEKFLRRHEAGENVIFDGITTQAEFITDRHAQVGIDHLLPFEEFDAVERFFEKRLGREVRFPRLNITRTRLDYHGAR